MIDDDSKYFSLSGDIPVGGPSTWHVIDWDQRRVISVTMDGEQEDESIAIQYLSRCSSQVPVSSFRIYVSNSGNIISTHAEAMDDQTHCVHYPSPHDLDIPEGTLTIRRDELEEINRLGPDADLVAYPPLSDQTQSKKVVFKYYFLWQYAQMAWKEMNLWMRLPHHPNIVPFDSVVVDELEGRVVGFTNKFIPGGNLEENTTRTFKLKWLQQLTDVVDDLNLRHGIAHQDIAPRNLLIDDESDCLMLFDFNFAARIGHTPSGAGESYVKTRNDVKGVIFSMYEIITRDNSLRDKPHDEQHIDDVEMDWVKHMDVKLDHPVASYQHILREWRAKRADDLEGSRTGDLPDAINWPSEPKPPQKVVSLMDVNGNSTSFVTDMWFERRQDVVARGGKVLNWERPPQEVLSSGVRLLSNGEIIN